MSGFDKEYRVCFPEKNIFISRDHNWAFAAWELCKLYEYVEKNATLVHVDAHLDDVWDGIKVKGLNDIENIDQAREVTRKLNIDNFIWAGFSTDAIDNVIYVARQNIGNQDPFDFVDWDFSLAEIEPVLKLLEKKKYEGVRVDFIEEFKELFEAGDLEKYLKNKAVILDLDLDYFNLSDDTFEPNLMDDEKIKADLEYLRDLYDWDLITVALSPIYCGGEMSCWHIYELFLEVFDLKLSEAEIW